MEDVDGIHKCCHSGVTCASSGDLSPRRTLTIQTASYRPSSLTKAIAKYLKFEFTVIILIDVEV